MQRDDKFDNAGDITIRFFAPGDETAFRVLNEQWIERYFQLEAKDRSALADPQNSIIERGGQILMAELRGRCVGCCALLRITEQQFEVAKMAVSPEHQGKGIGRLLLSAAITEVGRLGASRLYLETNDILKSAIALYKSFGFHHVDPKRVVKPSYARANVYMELILDGPQ